MGRLEDADLHKFNFTMSHTAFTYHLVFGTYRRRPVINTEQERELYKYMYDFAMSRNAKVWRIGGMPDHVHLLCDIPATISVADFVKLIKSETSKFMRTNSHFPYWEKWANGYAGFSVDASLIDARVQYIMNQKVHHTRMTFEDELRAILKEAGLDAECSILGDETV